MTKGVFISLRFRHPSKDLVKFCTSLGFEVDCSWQAGEQRKTSGGVPLLGMHTDSYCTCSVPGEGATSLDERLRKAVRLLTPSAEQLLQFSQDGGKSSFFVSLEKGAFEGATLDAGLLTELGRLEFSIEIDREL